MKPTNLIPFKINKLSRKRTVEKLIKNSEISAKRNQAIETVSDCLDKVESIINLLVNNETFRDCQLELEIMQDYIGVAMDHQEVVKSR